jgi:hypothetical protein
MMGEIVIQSTVDALPQDETSPRKPLKVKISDGTTGHSTRPTKYVGQAAGYKPDQACAKIRGAAY